MYSAKQFLGIGLVVVLVLGMLPTAEAATLTTLSVTAVDTSGPCVNNSFQIAFGWDATVNDAGSGYDRVEMIAFDGNGVPIAAGWNGISVGSSTIQVIYFGGGLGINALTARPVTIQVFDLVTRPPFGSNTQAIYDFIANSGTPLMSTLVYDPATDAPSCATLPYGRTVAGCDAYLDLPSTAVVGVFVADAQVYYAPGKLTDPLVTIPVGKTYWVLGMDEAGEYYQIYLQCQRVWVRAETIGPNEDATWQGRPLPTGVVQ